MNLSDPFNDVPRWAQNITCMPGWALHLGYVTLLDATQLPCIQWRYPIICADEGTPKHGITHKEFLWPGITETEFVRLAHELAKVAAMHEVNEWFKYMGVRPFGPHVSVHALTTVASVIDASPRR